MEFLTFFLAISGYAGLTCACVLGGVGRGDIPPRLVRAVALVVATHVVLVWWVRYGWQFERATRNGLVPFLIFHTALALIVAAAFVRADGARRLLWTAFPVVTLGALGAVFTYDVVAPYRVPVVVLAATGLTAMGRALWREFPILFQ